MLKAKIAIFLVSILFVGALSAGNLTAEQRAAKEKGIALYNQYKNGDKYLRIAAEAGDREAQYYLGESLRQAGFVTEESYKWLAAAANQGDLYAMVRLAYHGGNLCSLANECPEYAKTSSDWIVMFEREAKARAAKGDAEAMYVLYLGISDFDWLEKSAEAGYPQAQYLLAMRYKEGEGPFQWPWNKSQRIEELIKKSAEGGSIDGMNQYMIIFQERGELEKARYWLVKMAEAGDARAIGEYAADLAHTPDNRLGFPLDLVKGYGLMSLLLKLDGGGSSKDFAEDVLPDIAAKMTPEQIEEAKVFAEEWKASHPPLSYFPPKLGF
ncbi:sel1 repeat family protein [Pseudomonas sp. GOM7]|uniref:tetratricopeptide repeat protein n=1 Tax=Pseudomonas sp. GOM7 TaxID=2998079 RepID=UPI00227D1BB7|nr:sel1 repeat family protein [Pseudomonas sp. GOM7]WAJ37098.1 sel1 repeat family protein [Pseudomonas sp. GOM7]